MHDKRLIEHWLPIAALSEESVRERRSMTALPPIYYLHVWWARRPLVVSRAAVLASLLPSDADRGRLLKAIGIHGDPVAVRRRIDAARRSGQRFEGQAYSYPRAFSYVPDSDDRNWVAVASGRLGKDTIVLDPTAGEGSIPFEVVERDVVGRLAKKKGSDLLLWDSSRRAAKGALGQSDGSRGMIDAIHHAANRARGRSLADAREMLSTAQMDSEPQFFTALEAVLEVLPVPEAFSGIDLEGAAAAAGSDFEALYRLVQLAYRDRVDEPRQLGLWRDGASSA